MLQRYGQYLCGTLHRILRIWTSYGTNRRNQRADQNCHEIRRQGSPGDSSLDTSWHSRVRKERHWSGNDAFKIINSGAKKRKDAIEQFEAAGRTEAAEKERLELGIIMEFLPTQMTEDEVRLAVSDIIAQLGASQPSDFGKVMGVAVKQMKGKADGGLIQTLVKQLLSGS
jgi:uncharacterized protein YqeY